MAFKKNDSTNRSNGNGRNKEDWQADGFLNFYLPSREGDKRKIGSIPLRKNKALDQQLIEWLEADPANAQKLVQRMLIEYNSTDVDEAKMLDLDGL